MSSAASESPALRNLLIARNALNGVDANAVSIGPSMFDAGVVSFAHGEGIRRPYPAALHYAHEALYDDTRFPIENYLYRRPFPPLDERIAAEFHDLGIPPDLAKTVVIDAGTTRIILAAMSLLTRAGDMVITAGGFYHPVAAWCDLLGLELIVLADGVERGFRMSAETLEATLRRCPPGRRAVVLMFNPTLIGAAYPQADLDAIGSVLAAHDTVAIEDILLATADSVPGITRCDGRLARTAARDRVITVSGASKQHCLANLRIGWACGPSALLETLRERVCNASASIPHVAKAAALGALEATPAYRQGNVGEAARRLRFLQVQIAELDAQVRQATGCAEPLVEVAFEPEAGHSVLLDFSGFARARGLTGPEAGPDLTRFFLRESQTAFAPVSSQGIDGALLRANVVSVGTPFTYPVSREIEADWPIAWDAACEARFDFAFAQGRSLIARTLHERVAPAMITALRRGKRHDRAAAPQPSVLAL